MPVKSFEQLSPATDVTTTRTMLHEVLPVSGVIVSGTYGTFPDDTNVKNYTHGMFQSVYDYPTLSSSANHLFDATTGISSQSALSASGVTMMSKKMNMYNEFAQVLLGYSGSTGAVRSFESDLKLDQVGKMKDVFVISLSRLLIKDEIKKNTVTLQLCSGAWGTPCLASTITLTDRDARVNGDGVANAAGGDYGVLYRNDRGPSHPGLNQGYGVVFYQAGVLVVSSSVFALSRSATEPPIPSFYKITRPSPGTATTYNTRQALQSGSISGTIDALRHRIKNLTFNNTTEINSTIYFCRAPTHKFNYSSNPTYVKDSKIRIKNIAADPPISYITTVGLYNQQNELMAVAKLSEPLRKSIDNELTIRVRLDY